MQAGLPFLQIGTSQACFHNEGKDDEDRDIWNNFTRMGAKMEQHFLRSEAGMPSGPGENEGFKEFRAPINVASSINLEKQTGEFPTGE